jgi:hypothetical protein
MRSWQLFQSLGFAAAAVGASVALTLEGAPDFSANSLASSSSSARRTCHGR